MIRKHIKQQQEMQLTIECLEEELQTQHAQATQALHQAETQNKDLLHSTFLQRERVALLRRDKMKLTRDKECLLEQLRLAGINQALTKEKNLETPGDTLQQICANVIETNRQPWSSQLKKQYEQTVKKEAGVKGITHLQNI